ncbi:MAG: hypothetical protein FWF02_13070 [Micrococcales bacterium]|nr:hypothetical protein [Micrococcales bacterium]MCL2668606.1 hypothetical protein [Micrococcales bacterium]
MLTQTIPAAIVPVQTPAPDSAAHDAAALLEQALGALRAARSAVSGDLSARTHQRLLGLVEQVEAAATAVRCDVLTAVDENGTWALHGDRDLPAWLGRTTRAGTGAAFGQVRDATVAGHT